MAKKKDWQYINNRIRKSNNIGSFYNSQGKAQQDKFTPFCVSLADSKPFRELTTTQRLLYLYMTFQVPCKELKKVYDNNTFYFNRAIQRHWGLTNYRQNIKNIRVLVEKGFIEVVEDNRFNKRKNVYRLISEWQRKE